MYTVRYFIEDDVVEEREFDSLENACLAASELNCGSFAGTDPNEYSLYAEVIESEKRGAGILFWANSDGGRGTDMSENDDRFETVNEIINWQQPFYD